jgi:hypothetical protein
MSKRRHEFISDEAECTETENSETESEDTLGSSEEEMAETSDKEGTSEPPKKYCRRTEVEEPNDQERRFRLQARQLFLTYPQVCNDHVERFNCWFGDAGAHTLSEYLLFEKYCHYGDA